MSTTPEQLRFHADRSVTAGRYATTIFCRQAADEIKHLRGLLADKDYIAMKAKYNAGQLSWANMLDEREKRTT